MCTNGMFVVPRETPGVEIQPEPRNHNHIIYNEVRIPLDHLLGPEDGAKVLAQRRLGGGRIHHAMRTIAQCKLAFDMMCERALSRESHGKIIADHQMVQEKIADSYASIQMLRLFVLETAWKIDNTSTQETRTDIAAVKYTMAKVLREVSFNALHILGSLGTTNLTPLQAMYAAAPTMGIADGVDEVHKATVARNVLKRYRPHEGYWPTEYFPAKREAAAQEVRADVRGRPGAAGARGRLREVHRQPRLTRRNANPPDMTTHERELTEPVDLCTPDGTSLNPAALGWSRTPLHRANLDGCFGINKRWDYWAILAGDLVDLVGVRRRRPLRSRRRVLGRPHDRRDRRAHDRHERIRRLRSPGATGNRAAARRSGRSRTRDRRRRRAAPGSRASWTEADGRPGRLDVMVDAAGGPRVAQRRHPVERGAVQLHLEAPGAPGDGRAGRRRPAVGDRWVRTARSRGACSTSGGAGGRRRSPGTGAAARGGPGSTSSGLQFGAKWTEGSGFTENGLIVDGRLSKLGSELRWDYDWDEPMRPWHVEDPGGQLDVVLTPRFDKHSQLGGEGGQRDPPGVRDLVGPAADRRRARPRARRAAGLRRGGAPELVSLEPLVRGS